MEFQHSMGFRQNPPELMEEGKVLHWLLFWRRMQTVVPLGKRLKNTHTKNSLSILSMTKMIGSGPYERKALPWAECISSSQQLVSNFIFILCWLLWKAQSHLMTFKEYLDIETHCPHLQEIKTANEAYEKFTNPQCELTPDWSIGTMVWVKTENIKTKCPSIKFDHQMLGPFKIIKKVSSHA